ncbi:hypothetical protein SAMN06296241_2890 [Salinimicrobium sediminis]|uniref:N-terminal domain of galactosyltransferase n=1 Tax=Salinimicrobium sediminis TaxID=1343891 RepID=A0A285X7P7_9FLAO|nr:glycosyltransferase family 2 protein [Salinimicrobium sediminis]SOC81315.1 hypothetical protein SAMN06296241_2890 [Salinimicrobium sediminis]
MKTALLLSTYNWPEALRSVLNSIIIQSRLPDEILIADDGSGAQTKAVIEEFSNKSRVAVKHVWQEDKGFRKSAILNKAVAGTKADYIIQIDGDCILHPHFIKDHLARAEKGIFLFGSRVNIKPSAVSEVLEMDQAKFSLLSEAIKNKSRNLRIPLVQRFYKPTSGFSGKTRGCNLSYWREDFIAVNGYDEVMEGWGREDSEYVIRLLNYGVKGKRLRYGGIVYHIFHPEKSKEFLERNNEIQERTMREKKLRCEKGIDKYLEQA